MDHSSEAYTTSPSTSIIDQHEQADKIHGVPEEAYFSVKLHGHDKGCSFKRACTSGLENISSLEARLYRLDRWRTLAVDASLKLGFILEIQIR